MPKIGELNFDSVNIEYKKFGGGKYGKPQFSIEIRDPELAAALENDGVNLWYKTFAGKDEPSKSYVNVDVSFKFNDVQIAAVSDNGSVRHFNERNISDLDDLWIKDAAVYAIISRYKNRLNGQDVTKVYLKTMVVNLMSDEDQAQYRENHVDPIRSKYANLFQSDDNDLPFN